MTLDLSWCAIAVPRAPFESMQLQQFANGAKVTSARLITGKSLMSVAIVVENAFRPVNGRLDRQQLGLSRIRQICQ
jgi:hypothetical protein